MIPINNNLSVLPFYINRGEQNHRKSYAYGEIYPLYCELNHVPCFQIIREHQENDPITFARILYSNGAQYIGNIINAFIAQGLEIHEYPDEGIDVIVFPDTSAIGENFKEGQFYIELRDSHNRYYSDIFTAVADIQPYLKIEWWDEKNLVTDNGIIYYNGEEFKNKLYLCTELGKPDYTFQEEGETRDGYFFPQKQLSEKTYRFTFLAPEYLLDVMRLIRMADYVRITDKYGRIYNPDTFLMTPSWQEQGDLASVECEFQTDTVVKKIGNYITNQ